MLNGEDRYTQQAMLSFGQTPIAANRLNHIFYEASMSSQKAKAELFKSMHVKGDPIILFNIWDAGSAKVITDSGAKAVATGSAVKMMFTGSLMSEPIYFLKRNQTCTPIKWWMKLLNEPKPTNKLVLMVFLSLAWLIKIK